MNADERLDQLEPLLSEALTVLDRHTYQLKQLFGAVTQLTSVVAQQGDNISFLLREQSGLKTDVAELKTDVAELKTDIAGLKTDVTGLIISGVGMEAKLDLLIQMLQKPGQ